MENNRRKTVKMGVEHLRNGKLGVEHLRNGGVEYFSLWSVTTENWGGVLEIEFIITHSGARHLMTNSS